jgi:hypothetical protein
MRLLDNDIVRALYDLRRRSIARLIARRAQAEARHLRQSGRKPLTITDGCSGTTHWYTATGLVIMSDLAVCGEEVRHICGGKARRPINCVRCQKLLARFVEAGEVPATATDAGAKNAAGRPPV